MAATHTTTRMARRAAIVFAAASAALALATALRLPAAWESGNALNHVSGVWLTLADDLARGTLYRPLHAPGSGYGGTRYFPLVFALQAGLVRMGAPLRGPGRARVPLAAVALTLAFGAKPTALTAAAAAVAALVLRRARRGALALAGLVSALALAAVAVTDALSAGRFLAGLRELATAGATAGTVVRAPLRLAEQLALGDPAGLVLALGAAVALAASLHPLLRAVRAGADDPRLVPALWLAAAWGGALVVFATPGTGVNHLLEVEAASAALLGATASAPGRARTLARAWAPAAALAGLAVALALWRADASSSRLAELRGVVRALPPGAPVLSEDPLVPLLAGERPYLLDPFTIRLTAARAPEVWAPLADAIRHGAFPSVVLFEDLASPASDRWYAEGNLGLPLAAEIRRGYRRAGGFGRYHLYLPRAAAGAGAGAGVVRRDEAG